MVEKLSLNRDKTALVLIDLQNGIVARETSPNPTDRVIKNASALAQYFRSLKMPVFLVHVEFPGHIALKFPNDDGYAPNEGAPKSWSEFVPEIGPEEGDIIITKHQWGAFYGTELDLQLRRRGITTLVLGGISTTYGVESTARFAYEYGYEQIFAEDAISDYSAESHKAAIKFVLKRIGRVRPSSEIMDAL